MAGIGVAPSRSMIAENIRDLQRRTRHASRALGGRVSLLELAREVVEWTHDLADGLGGNASIERRGIELGVPERS
jgi:hypothetical protein